MARQREYKVAALNAKRAGDLDHARELMRIGKVRQLVQRPCVQTLISQNSSSDLLKVTGLHWARVRLA